LFHNPLKWLLISHLIVNAGLITSCAVNCGGKQTTYSDSLPNIFYDDTSDLGAAGFHINTDGQWVVSHVGSDPLSNSSDGIVSTSQGILGTDTPELYQTARTSQSDLWYYVVGLSMGNYTVQLFFAEIIIEGDFNNRTGRRSFNIDIQVCSLKITNLSFTLDPSSTYEPKRNRVIKLQDQNIKTDFDITKEAEGFRKATNITYEAMVDSSVLKIHLYWHGRGTHAIPYEGAYGPLVSAIRGIYNTNTTLFIPFFVYWKING
jgi:hypothetical protein